MLVGLTLICKMAVPPLAGIVPLKSQVTKEPPPLATFKQSQPVPLLLTNVRLVGSWSSTRALNARLLLVLVTVSM